MKKNKLHFVFDKSVKVNKLKKNLLKNNNNYSAEKSDTIVVFGGDGFMLETLMKLSKFD